MSHWSSQIRMTRRDGLKAAGVILGLLFGCIFAVWLLTRFVVNRDAAPAGNPPAGTTPKPAPTPRAGQ